MIHKSFLIFLLLSVSAAFSSTGFCEEPAASGPTASVPQQHYDFGTIFEGTKVNHAFIIGNVGQLEALIQKYQPDVVFIISETLDIDKYADIHKTCNRNSIKLKIVSPKVNHILSHSKIRDVLGVSLVFESWRIYYWRFNSRVKRIFDVLFVIVTSPIILPLGIIISVIIKLTSSGPVFFKQRRALYEGGPEFLCYKFRSMYKDAEGRLHDLLRQPIVSTK